MSQIKGAVQNACLTEAVPKRLIGNRAYDSDKLDAQLALRGLEMIAPHRTDPSLKHRMGGHCGITSGGEVERVFTWLQSFRRIHTRDEYNVNNYEGMVQLGCAVLLLRHLCNYF